MASNKNNPFIEIDSDADSDSLQFQSFTQTTMAPSLSGKMSTSAGATGSPVKPQTPSQPAHTIITVENVQQNINRDAKTKHVFYSVDFYREYFNVDSSEVGRRLLASIIPTSYFFDLMGHNPDLYGPFWISTTVVAVAFVCNFIGSYIRHVRDDTNATLQFTYDTQMLSVAATVSYCFVTICPFVIWGLMRWFSFKPRFIEIVCIYGYGMTIWIPLLFVSMVPFTGLNYILAASGLGLSTLFSVRNYYPFFTSSGDPQAASFSLTTKKLSAGTIVMLFILASQVAFAATFLFVLTVPK